MEKYSYTPEQRACMEGMEVPFAVYQFLDHRVVTLILSDGFCQLFGYAERAQAYYDMDHDMYKDTHPDDVSRIADAAVRFATEGGQYDVFYRTRIPGTRDYRVVHALGVHFFTPEGVRLAQVWYTDEGPANEENVPGRSRACEDYVVTANRYDFLTGLPGMTYFFELAEAEKGNLLRAGEKPVILYLNFSGMKYYNHKFGFMEGNRLLMEFGKRLSATFGNENCGRIGQDNFVVLAGETGIEERLARFFEDVRGLNGGNSLPLRVGISRDWDEGDHVSRVCDRAKIACDQLRNTVVSSFGYSTAALRETMRRGRMICENLDRAIAEKWIQVYYQPIVRAANGLVCDEEALARWVDPEEGILPPDSFIPYLEDAGLIHKLDLYVLEQVLEKFRVMQKSGYRPAPCSVNLSRADFSACDMVEEIRRRVDAAGVDRSLIAVEITERIIGGDFEHMKKQIERFRALGFPVWLDDFGSGYSSLDALQSIRFDVVKFDMSFMKKLSESESSRIVLTELIKLATSLGAATVCEGVETTEQVRFLQEIGCAKLQGFFFGRPVPAETLQERYRDDKPSIGYENPEEVAYYEAIGKELNGYSGWPVKDRESYYFNGMFLRLVRALDYLCSRKEWDRKRVLITGGSQGGAQSAALAGLDPRVSMVVVDVPAMWDVGGMLVGRTSSWNKPLEREGVNSTAAKVAPYYDAANFMRYFTGKLVVNVGLIDLTCPPADVWAVFNICPASSKVIHPCAWKGHSGKYSVPKDEQDEMRKHMGKYLDAAIEEYLR